MGLYPLKDLRNSSVPKEREADFQESEQRGAGAFPSEAEFGEIILRERRRTDRSRRPFLLMLLEVEGIHRSNARGNLLKKVSHSIALSIRDTDTLGWHKEQSVIGVLFTELSLSESISVTKVIHTRILTVLAMNLAPEELNRVSIRLHVYPDHWAVDNEHPLSSDLYPDLKQMQARRKISQILKRAMDIGGSLVALVILFPVMAVIASVLKLTSAGPVLFRQPRLGRYCQRFTLLKFRTMYCEADDNSHKSYMQQYITDQGNGKHEEGTGVVYKIQDDPRITPVGKFLRKTSLDELPQFWNVLTGEMSLVGPRPPIPYEVECYEAWHRRRLFEAKPGITGLWQVCGRSRTKFNDMVRLDLQYAKSWSLWLDLKILLRTPLVVIFGDGAY